MQAMKTTSKRRQWTYSAVALVALALLAFSILRTPAVAVETGEVTRGSLIVTVDSPGRTRVVDRYTITAPVSGSIERIDLREGDRVEQKQQVAAIRAGALDPRSSAEARSVTSGAESTAAAAAASVAEAEAELRLANSEAQRVEALAYEGVVSQQALDSARTRREIASRNVAAARQRAAAARAEVARSREAAGLGSSSSATVAVIAPSSGEILRIPDRSARPVAAGETLMEIGDARRIEVVADFLSEDAVRIRAGNPAILRDWGGGEPLRGSVRLVEPSGFTKISALGIEEQRVNVIIEIADPPDALGDGYRVDAAVVVWQEENALRVPISALGRVGEQWSVIAVEDGTARPRIVRIGERNSEYAQVLEGLDEGATVILHPSAEIEDGTAVRSIK